MDIPTLIISTLVVSFFMTLALFCLYRISPSEKYLIDWSLVGAFFFASNFIGLIGAKFTMSSLLAPAFANAFYISGHAAIFTGVVRLTTQRSLSSWLIPIWLCTVLLHNMEFTQASVNNRVITFYPLIIGFNLLAAFFAWKARNSNFGRALWLLIAVELAFVIQLTVRGSYMVYNITPMTLFGSEFMQTSGTLFLLIFIFLLTLSFVTILNWKKEVYWREFAITDHLTGWLNRRALAENASALFSLSKREFKPFSFLVFDIDHFKLINDKHGHAVGDKAIQHTCNTVKLLIRDYDYYYRLGGEEFAIMIYNCDRSTIASLAERIRSKVQSTPLVHSGKSIELTISLGYATSLIDDTNWDQTLERADKALYEAKEGGRNRVESFTLKLTNDVATTQ